MLLCIVLPIIFAFKSGIDKQKSKLWVYTTFSTITLALILTISPPIAGNFSDAMRFSDTEKFKDVDVYLNTKDITELKSEEGWLFEIQDKNIFQFSEESLQTEQRLVFTNNTEIKNLLEESESIVVTLNYNNDLNRFDIKKVVSKNPIIQYPYLPALQHRIKNLNLHVPLHWVAVIAYMVSMIFSIKFLNIGTL